MDGLIVFSISNLEVQQQDFASYESSPFFSSSFSTTYVLEELGGLKSTMQACSSCLKRDFSRNFTQPTQNSGCVVVDLRMGINMCARAR